MKDTHPDVERRQVELLAQAGPARRLALACYLSQMTIAMLRRAIKRRWPHLSSQGCAIKQIELCHGEDLARRLTEYLAKKECNTG